MLIPDMEFDIMWENELIGHICIKDEEIIEAVQYDCEYWKRFLPLSKEIKVDINLLAQLFESRCWDRNRTNIDEILEKIGLDSYNPFKIILHTRGIDYDEKMWFKFSTDDENLRWEDVDPRRET